MNDLVLIEDRDPPALASAAERAAGTPLPWVAPEDPRAAEATVWFCATRPPAAPRALTRLRWIHSGWAGVDAWFARPEWRDGVRLTRTIGDFPDRVAEYVAGYLLADALGVREAIAGITARSWDRWTPATLAGRSMLVVGHGAIGRRVAEVARALRMATRGVRRGPLTAEDHAAGVEEASALEALLPAADVVVNLLPLTRDTESFWDAPRFDRMKEGAVFVNASRGRTVDEAALLAGLARRRPARAILDVFREEPLPAGHPIRDVPGVWITPHVAGTGTTEPLARDFAANWRRYRAGEPLGGTVDRARGY
ncbi:MAG TPA: D-2-hydroxyacid dehydrogenase [Candidatus Eisenbacteria bacterium]